MRFCLISIQHVSVPRPTAHVNHKQRERVLRISDAHPGHMALQKCSSFHYILLSNWPLSKCLIPVFVWGKKQKKVISQTCPSRTWLLYARVAGSIRSLAPEENITFFHAISRMIFTWNGFYVSTSITKACNKFMCN